MKDLMGLYPVQRVSSFYARLSCQLVGVVARNLTNVSLLLVSYSLIRRKCIYVVLQYVYRLHERVN